MTNIDEIKTIVDLAKYHESSELFHEWATTTILELCSEIERLNAEQKKRRDDIHTCHDQCERIACVQRREIDELKLHLNWIIDGLDHIVGTQSDIDQAKYLTEQTQLFLDKSQRGSVKKTEAGDI